MDWSRFQNWYREESFVAVFPGGHELRITIGVSAGADDALYRHYISEAFAYIQEKYKVVPKSLTDDENASPRDRSEWRRLFDRSYMLATLRRVEVKEAGDWVEQSFPPDWIDCEHFGKMWPGAINAQWRNVTDDLNPGLYNPGLDEVSEKNVRILVGPLLN